MINAGQETQFRVWGTQEHRNTGCRELETRKWRYKCLLCVCVCLCLSFFIFTHGARGIAPAIERRVGVTPSASADGCRGCGVIAVAASGKRQRMRAGSEESEEGNGEQGNGGGNGHGWKKLRKAETQIQRHRHRDIDSHRDRGGGPLRSYGDNRRGSEG